MSVPQGLFNFKPSVRPVPLEAHIQGYPGKFYCPRMASMNKPTYAAIQARASFALPIPVSQVFFLAFEQHMHSNST